MELLEQYFHQFCVRNSKLARPRRLLPFYEKYVDRTRTRVLIACMPKSGSTYMSQLLRHYLGLPHHYLIWDYGKSEQEICWTKLAAVMKEDAFFVQQHVRATDSTLKALRLFNIHTIVMVRNLPDVVVSFRDHILNESPDNPMAYVDPDFVNWPERTQYEFIIDMAIPWYLNFLGTWSKASHEPGISLLWLKYSDWIGDTAGTLKKIDAFCGLKHTDEDAERAIAKAQGENIRLNVGRGGRGRELLDEEQLARIRRLMSYYPGCREWCDQLI